MKSKTDDRTKQFDSTDIAGNKTAAAFSYLGVFVLVPLFTAKDSEFARFHANQGLALLLAGVAYNIIAGILTAAFLSISWRLYPAVKILQLLGLIFPVFMLIGICNAINGKAKELPIIGKVCLLR